MYCETDEHFEKYARFMIKNRKEIHIEVKDLIPAICDHFNVGRIIIVLNENDDVIAAVSYFIGRSEDISEDDEIAFLDSTILLEQYRTGFIFIRGLKSIVDDIIQTNRTVKEIRLVVHENNKYVQKLYGKFAKCIEKRDEHYLIYSTSIETLQTYINKFEKRLSK